MSDDDVTFHLPVKDPIPTENQVFVTMTQEESAKVEAIREELNRRMPPKTGSNCPRCTIPKLKGLERSYSSSSLGSPGRKGDGSGNDPCHEDKRQRRSLTVHHKIHGTGEVTPRRVANSPRDTPRDRRIPILPGSVTNTAADHRREARSRSNSDDDRSVSTGRRMNRRSPCPSHRNSAIGTPSSSTKGSRRKEDSTHILEDALAHHRFRDLEV